MKEEFKKALKEITVRYRELEKKLSDVNIVSNFQLCQKYAREKARLESVVNIAEDLDKKRRELKDIQEILTREEGDPEFQKLAEEERGRLLQEIENGEKELENAILKTLVPPETYRNILVEIRAGTGGEEACLFAADLYKMYTKYAQKQGWKQEIMDSHPTSLGGFKEIVFSLSGDDVYSKMKYESGVHRVQRVPVTEAGGRIHTSAVSVVVLPEPEEVEVDINPKDLRIDTFRASGPGGQYVNVTDSAVRITHIPTGIVVSCQDERSQLKNRQKAMRILKARLLDIKRREQEREMSETRKKSIGSGDRSEKIRTYNFAERRVTDHRIGLTLYKLDQILEGELDELIESLMIEDRKRILKDVLSKDRG
ncbi:MAG: peptide chain release factor 1 [Candidatus Omnitrophica bacterium]|nr:peptide chain release factor 1 [Candidatus Omnitrophota bacterium]